MDGYYFEEPTLGFYIDSSGNPIPGIGYYDDIICQCCGTVHDIGDIIENAKKFNYLKAFYPYDSWEEGINADFVPRGLCFVEMPDGEITVAVDPTVKGWI